jgi:hypothetical protein
VKIIQQEIQPGKKHFKNLYLRILLWFVGRAFQAASRVDKTIQSELEKLPEDFSAAFTIDPFGPAMYLKKRDNKSLKFTGMKKTDFDPQLTIRVKNVEAAMLLFTFQESTVTSESNNRLIADGPIPLSCAFVRIMNIVEIFLLPKIIAKRAVKRYESPKNKIVNRVRIYTRTILGY